MAFGQLGWIEPVLVVARGGARGRDHHDRRDPRGGDLGVEQDVQLPAGVAKAAVVVVPHVLAVVHEQDGVPARGRGRRVVARRQVRRDGATVAERGRASRVELDEVTQARVRGVEHRVPAVGIAGVVVVRERRVGRIRLGGGSTGLVHGGRY